MVTYDLGCDKDEDRSTIIFFGKRCGSWYGKWGFPEDTKYSNNHDYISFNSIGSFTVLGVDMSFLKQSVQNWVDSESYNAAKSAVQNRKLINDSTERGVIQLKRDFKISFK